MSNNEFWKSNAVHFASLVNIGGIAVLMGALALNLSTNPLVIEYGLQASYVKMACINTAFGLVFIIIGATIFIPSLIIHLISRSKILEDSC